MIFGLGEFARVLAFHVAEAHTAHRSYLPVGHYTRAYEDLPENTVHYVAVGPKDMNQHREALYNEIRQRHILSTWIHPKAIVDGTLGLHNIIFELNNIQPFSVIGDNVVLWSGNHIGHHSKIGSHSFISSHCVISGGVTIGERCFLGVNCTIRDHVKIGNRCFIAPASYVDRDMPDDSVWKGDQLLRIKSDQVKL